MLKLPYIFAVNVLLALLSWTGAAKAQSAELTSELALSFELPAAKASVAVEVSQPATPPLGLTPDSVAVTPVELPNDKVAIASLTYASEALPPITTVSDTEQTIETEPTADNAVEEPVDSEMSGLDAIALTFSADTVSLNASPDSEVQAVVSEVSQTEEPVTLAAAPAATESLAPVQFDPSSLEGWSLDDWIFENGSNSLVARTVGSAEGTRYSDGKKTQAYYGHVDPGNGVWNLGTFSYQHEANSPEEADRKQLQRLKRQGLQLVNQATNNEINLSLEEKLNGLDLANQAPLAALDKGGYIERLAQARRLQMEGSDAILWARTYAYIDPDTRRWNAPGLGNNVHSISQDQERRMSAISQAMKAYDPNVMAQATITASSLDGLEKVTLRNTAVSGPSGVVLSGGPTDPSSTFAKIEVSFELPAASESTPTASSILAAVGEPPTNQAESATETPDSSHATSPRAATTAVTLEANDLGVTFLPSDVMSSLTLAEASPETSAEDTHPEDASQGGASVAETDTPTKAPAVYTAAEPANRPITDANDADLFSLEEEKATVADSSDTNESAEKLQRLLTGAEADQLTSAEREQLLNQSSSPAKGDVSFWRTEDKIVPEK